ncbi:excitatory amino acid transporter 2-like [Tropilaelaps mercedesae]|uniref:Amino acid transporter n=1 Tax=Tropilaelaps mercedesae TaxID=418985 RepID=A0A1V9Y3P9_9ACAR|nr:excitatory amino acid transporter 2-like [Tropilaelaps mercedesae]
MFPTNLIQACFQLHRTIRVMEASSVFPVGLNTSEVPRVLRREFEYSDGLNVFGVIVFCSVFGLVSGYMGPLAQTHVQFFSILNSICMRLAYIVNWYFPLGVFFLIVHSCVTGDDLGEHVADVRLYVLTVLGGLMLHSFLILPTCYFVIVRRNPLVLAKQCLHAILVGFGTSDSVASVPVTMSCLEVSGIDRRVTRFVLPIACAFNLDGTALYAAVGSIFVANLNGIQLNFEHYIIVGIVAALTSFANRGIPNAVVITMVLVLQAAGLSAKHLPLLLAVDWIMNRCRTAVNVFSQAIAAAVVARAVRRDLEHSEEVLEEYHWERVSEVGVTKRLR